MTHTHAFNEITRFEDTERQFVCECGERLAIPFMEVDPFTGIMSEAEVLADQERRILARIKALPDP